MQYHFRAAYKDDCPSIALLYRIAAEGVADYIWTTLAEPNEKILDTGIRRYQRENTAFSYQNCTIVEIDKKVVGIMLAFEMQIDPEEEAETDPVLIPFSKLEEDNSYYIAGIALYPEFRSQGIGATLLLEAEKQAKAKGLNKMSLIVFAQNSAALKLYQRLDYKELARETLVEHPQLECKGDALLMVKEI